MRSHSRSWGLGLTVQPTALSQEVLPALRSKEVLGLVGSSQGPVSRGRGDLPPRPLSCPLLPVVSPPRPPPPWALHQLALGRVLPGTPPPSGRSHTGVPPPGHLGGSHRCSQKALQVPWDSESVPVVPGFMDEQHPHHPALRPVLTQRWPHTCEGAAVSLEKGSLGRLPLLSSVQMSHSCPRPHGSLPPHVALLPGVGVGEHSS